MITKLNQLIENGETVKGSWKLDGRNEVSYITRSNGKEEVKFKGAILDAKPGELVLAVTKKKDNHRVVTSLVTLTGKWQADPKNRLSFEIKKENGRRDLLTFKGVWELNKTNEIIYTWKTQQYKTRTKETQTLTFQGHWDIDGKNRLTYLVGGSSENAFRFRGALQSKSITAKEGEIRYQIGMEVRGKVRARAIAIFGKWKLSKDLELSFEVEYSNGQKHTITFGALYRLNDDTAVEVELKTRNGQPLGAVITLTHEFWQDNAQLFVRLQKSVKEKSLEGGVKIAW